jgi:hypothetical protein
MQVCPTYTGNMRNILKLLENPLQNCIIPLKNISFPVFREFFLSENMFGKNNKLIFLIAGCTGVPAPTLFHHSNNPFPREFFLPKNIRWLKNMFIFSATGFNGVQATASFKQYKKSREGFFIVKK